jgi:uncharacterized protein YyaL (SSP411 family)
MASRRRSFLLGEDRLVLHPRGLAADGDEENGEAFGKLLMLQSENSLRKMRLKRPAEVEREGLALESRHLALHHECHPLEDQLDSGSSNDEWLADERPEIIDGEALQHRALIAQPLSMILAIVLFLLLPAIGAAAPWRPWTSEASLQLVRGQAPAALLITSGSCRPCAAAEQMQTPRFFVPLLINHDEMPELAGAWLAFAEANAGRRVTLPVVVVVNQRLEPVAAIDAVRPDTVGPFLQSIEAGWSDDAARAWLERLVRLRESGWRPDGSLSTGSQLEEIWSQVNETATAAAAIARLAALSRTGVYDQLGGGFHRAARDDAWRQPEFEKMLRDQALALLSATAAWQRSRDERMRMVALATAELILREFHDPAAGTFHNALGSHSLVPRGRPHWAEGGSYVWDAEEIRHLLGEKVAPQFEARFGIRSSGNLPEGVERSGDLQGKNVPLLEAETPFDESEELAAAREKLLSVRLRRPPPVVDPTRITRNNALTISALARAGSTFDEPRYIRAAARASTALLTAHYDQKSGAVVASRGKRKSAESTPLDYALLVKALLDTFEAAQEPAALAKAIELQQRQIERFPLDQLRWIGNEQSVPTVVRGLSSTVDVAQITAENLARLGSATARREWVAAAGQLLGGEPPQHLQVIVAGEGRTAEVRQLERVIRDRLRPAMMLIVVDSARVRDALAGHLPLMRKLPECRPGRLGMLALIDGSERCLPVALICEGGECEPPIEEPGLLAARIPAAGLD